MKSSCCGGPSCTNAVATTIGKPMRKSTKASGGTHAGSPRPSVRPRMTWYEIHDPTR
jgi:hypothetical protein